MNLINQLYSNPEPFDIHNAKVTCLQTSIQVCIEKVFLPKFLLCWETKKTFKTNSSSFTFCVLLWVHVWKFNLMHKWYLIRTIWTKSDILPVFFYKNRYIHQLQIDQKTIIFGILIHLFVMFGIILLASYLVFSKNWI